MDFQKDSASRTKIVNKGNGVGQMLNKIIEPHSVQLKACKPTQPFTISLSNVLGQDKILLSHH